MARFNYFGAVTVMENMLKRKWSAVILRHLADGILAPSEVCSREPDLSLPVLNERLRTMQRYNLITRSPARAQAQIQSFRLTPRGHRILKLLTVIEQFDQVEEIVIKTNPTGRFHIEIAVRSAASPAEPTLSAGGP